MINQPLEKNKLCAFTKGGTIYEFN